MEEDMQKITLTIRGIDADLIKQARSKAIRQGMRTSEWLNEAIREKLIKDSMDLPFNLDQVAESTERRGVYRVPMGTIMVGSDYTVNRRYICAAGRKEGEEAVTYDSPGTLCDLGYEIFWVR
jgi:hypothetical protein